MGRRISREDFNLSVKMMIAQNEEGDEAVWKIKYKSLLFKKICEAVSAQLCIVQGQINYLEVDVSKLPYLNLNEEGASSFNRRIEDKIDEACIQVDWRAPDGNGTYLLVEHISGKSKSQDASEILKNAMQSFITRKKRETRINELTNAIGQGIQAVLTQQELLSHRSIDEFRQTMHSGIGEILESQLVQDCMEDGELGKITDRETGIIVEEIIKVFKKNNIHTEVVENVLDKLSDDRSELLHKLSNKLAIIWSRKKTTTHVLHEIGKFFEEKRDLSNLESDKNFILKVNESMAGISHPLDLVEVANIFISCATCFTEDYKIAHIVQKLNIDRSANENIDFEKFWAFVEKLMAEISSCRTTMASTKIATSATGPEGKSDEDKDNHSITYHLIALLKLIAKSLFKELGKRLPGPVSEQIAAFAASRIVQASARVLANAIDFMRLFIMKNLAGDAQTSAADPNQSEAIENGKQIRMLSHRNTIWHAVSNSGSKEGKRSWCLVRLVASVALALGSECWWMEGGEQGARGVFGETPLHILLLFGGGSADARTLFTHLWEACPRLRTAQYTHRLYRGENVLHIAVIRRVGMGVIETILGGPEAEARELLGQRATGEFFRNEHNGCHLLGEHALTFAACTGQLEVVRRLVDRGADLGVRTERGGNNLLHLMVLNAARGAGPAGAEAGGGDGDGVYMDMYDRIEEMAGERPAHEWREGSLYEQMRQEPNDEGLTPLWLAAATGSARMFEHLFAKELETVWTYGAVTCRRLFLRGIDRPPDRDDLLCSPTIWRATAAGAVAGGATAGGDDAACSNPKADIAGPASTQAAGGGLTARSDADGGKRTPRQSLLETLVRAGRQDILRASLIDRVVDAKWERYGRATFLRHLAAATAVAAVLLVLPVMNIAGESRPWRSGLLALAYVALAGVALPARAYWADGRICPGALKGLFALGGGGAVRGSVVDWEATVARALSMGLVALAAFVAAQGLAGSLPLGPWAACSVWAERAERTLCAATSAAAFARVLLLSTGFEMLGPFLLMIVRVARVDFPPFLAVYGVLLLAFAHLHFFASNRLHAGLEHGADSLWRVFTAVLGDIKDEEAHVSADALASPATYAVSVANYFVVSVVLLNLLVATLSGTYERISAEACGTWRLHRAALLVSIDADLAAQGCRDGRVCFWQTAAPAAERGGRCGPVSPRRGILACVLPQRVAGNLRPLIRSSRPS